MGGVILCVASLIAAVLMIAILSKVINNQDRNKPVFGRLIINLQDPNADMFKLEIDIDDPNVLLQAKQVILKVIETTATSTNSQKKQSL